MQGLAQCLEVAPGHQIGRGLKLFTSRATVTLASAAPGHQTGQGLKHLPDRIELAMMQEYACHHLPVLNGGKLIGNLMSGAPIVIESAAEISTAIRTMLDNKINNLIVRAEGNKPWGILTSTDLLRYVMEKV